MKFTSTLLAAVAASTTIQAYGSYPGTNTEWIKFLERPLVNDASGPSVWLFSLTERPESNVTVIVRSRQLSIPVKRIHISPEDWDKPQTVLAFPHPTCSNRNGQVQARFRLKFDDSEEKIVERKQVERQFKETGYCVSSGDPHIRTLDGYRFDNHNDGVFWLYKSHDLKVQESQFLCRQLYRYGMIRNIYCNNAVAVQYKGDAMIFAPKDFSDWSKGFQFYVPNGSEADLKAARVAQIGQHHFAVIDKYTGQYILKVHGFRGGNQCGSNVRLNIVVFAKASEGGKTEGMCGNFDRDYYNDNVYHGVKYNKRWELAQASRVPEDEDLFTLCGNADTESNEFGKCRRGDFGYGPWLPGLPGFTMLDYLQYARLRQNPPQGYRWANGISWDATTYEKFTKRNEVLTCETYEKVHDGTALVKRENTTKVEEHVGSAVDLAGGSFDKSFYSICEKSINLLDVCRGVLPESEFKASIEECTADSMMGYEEGKPIDVATIEQIVASYSEDLQELCHLKVQSILEPQEDLAADDDDDDEDEDEEESADGAGKFTKRRLSKSIMKMKRRSVANEPAAEESEEVQTARKVAAATGVGENTKCPNNCGGGNDMIGVCTDTGCKCFNGYHGLGCEKEPVNAKTAISPEELLKAMTF